MRCTPDRCEDDAQMVRDFDVGLALRCQKTTKNPPKTKQKVAR